jgi:hypothetical protein
MKTTTVESTMTAVDAWLDKSEMQLQRELGPLNTSIEEGIQEPQALINFAVQIINKAVIALGGDILENLDPERARRVLKVLGFLTSSAEKHYQDRGHESGAGINRLPGAAQLMLDLAVVAHHPPRDSHTTYWFMNNALEKEPITFTGNPQEAKFNKAVNLTEEKHSESVALLRPICTGEVAIDTRGAANRLMTVARNTQAVLDEFRSIMEVLPEEHRRAIEPIFFMMRMRTYLLAYPVGSKMWLGVNAANIPSQMALDYLLGIVTDEYAETVEGRLPFMPDEEQVVVANAMSIPSILDRLLEAMQLTPEQVVTLSHDELRTIAQDQPANLRYTLFAFELVLRVIAGMTAYHWSLIQNYLVKVAKDLPPEVLAKMPVPPTRGTGRKSHEDTWKIVEMRREHPVAGKLVKSVGKGLQLDGQV